MRWRKKKKRKKKKKSTRATRVLKIERTCFLQLLTRLLCVTRHAESIDQSQLETNSWLNRFIDKYEKYQKSFLVFNLAAIVRSWVKNQGTTFKVYAWHACGSMSRKYRWIGALRKQQLLCLVSKKKIQTVCIEFEMISNFLPREDGMHLGYSLCVRIEWWIFCRSRWVSSLTLLRF